MENYNYYYLRADNLLKLIAEKPGKRMLKRKVYKYYNTYKEAEILTANHLIEILIEDDRELVQVTVPGEEHIKNGGFSSLLAIEPTKPDKVPFRRHLEEHTNLLTIFGILNALILFSAQGKEINPKELDLLNTGMQILSASMYVLSILVLIELIDSTSYTDDKSWKFKVFHLGLLWTTFGIGLIFWDKYSQFVAAFGIVAAFLIATIALAAGMLGAVYLLSKTFLRTPIRYKENVILVVITCVMILSVIAIEYLKYKYIKK